MSKLLILFVLLCSSIYPQASVSVSSNQTRLYYDGNGNLQYICTAKSIQPVTSSLQVIAAVAGSPILLTLSGPHGLLPGSTVSISGSPGMAGLVGTFTVTPHATDPAKVYLNNSTGTGTFIGTSTFLKTVSPRGTGAIWSIQKLIYDSNNNLINTIYANGSNQFTFSCDTRTSYGYQ